MSDLQIKQANIAYRFKTPYPFNETTLLNKVIESERFFAKDEPVNVGPANIGVVEVYYSESERTLLNFQPQEGIFGLKSSDYNECVELFRVLQNFIFDAAEADRSEISYLEYSVNGLYKPANSSPLDIVTSKIGAENDFVFGEDSMKLFGLRLFSADGYGETSIKKIRFWSDIRIEPFLLNPQLLFWAMTFRNTEEKALDHWSNLPERIISFLEG